MSKLVAVRATGPPEALVLEGLVSRGKNRKVVWRVDGRGKSRQEIREEANEKESKRVKALPVREGTPVDYEH